MRETFGADFGMENMGGIRAPLLRGTITRGDLVTLDPFNNTVVLFKATGREIRQLLERLFACRVGDRSTACRTGS